MYDNKPSFSSAVHLSVYDTNMSAETVDAESYRIGFFMSLTFIFVVFVFLHCVLYMEKTKGVR